MPSFSSRASSENAGSRNADVYGHLGERSVSSVIGFEDGILLADVAAYHRWKHLSGDGSLKWRSGIKHDCAKVMELCLEGGRYRNGLGELAEIENLYVYPMLKSSAVARRDAGTGSRFMLVTQTSVRDETDRHPRASPQNMGLPSVACGPAEQARELDLSEAPAVFRVRGRWLQLCALEGGH